MITIFLCALCTWVSLSSVFNLYNYSVDQVVKANAMTSYNLSNSLCSASTFSAPAVFGTEILSLTANPVTNFSSDVSDLFWFNHPSVSVRGVDFCNVTVTYTHPGQNNTIHVTSWLPTPDVWNERVQATGGGGLVAGGPDFVISRNALAGAVGEGYAATTTDAGIDTTSLDLSWVLLSPGNINLYNAQTMGSVSLSDQALIGKSLVQDYYGKPAKYSYFSGCSQGGRQGLILAQRYPGLYDGIASSAPAIKLNKLSASIYWPQLVMKLAGAAVPACELDALTAAALSHCDGKDGVVDGLISDLSSCDYDPFSSVGTSFTCVSTGATRNVSQLAAEIANATWSGPESAKGDFIYYGPNMGADITGTLTYQATAMTKCSTNGTCVGSPNMLGTAWLQLFIAKNAEFDLEHLTLEQFGDMIHRGEQQYSGIFDAVDPDLSAFKAGGGKMLGYHGTADQIIPSKSTLNYYNSVMALDANVHDYYRMFEAPGVQHCSNGVGGKPSSTFAALVAWVENGTVPQTLPVSSMNNGTTYHKRLCPIPAKSVYDGIGDPTLATSFKCV